MRCSHLMHFISRPVRDVPPSRSPQLHHNALTGGWVRARPGSPEIEGWLQSADRLVLRTPTDIFTGAVCQPAMERPSSKSVSVCAWRAIVPFVSLIGNEFEKQRRMPCYTADVNDAASINKKVQCRQVRNLEFCAESLTVCGGLFILRSYLEASLGRGASMPLLGPTQISGGHHHTTTSH